MRKAERMTMDIIDYGKLAIVAMIMIYVVYLVAESLVGQAPAIISLIIIGIASTYIYVTDDKIRSEINAKFRGKK